MKTFVAQHSILLDPKQFLVVCDHDDDGGVRGHAARHRAGQVCGLALRHIRGPGHVHTNPHHCQQLPGVNFLTLLYKDFFYHFVTSCIATIIVFNTKKQKQGLTKYQIVNSSRVNDN